MITVDEDDGLRMWKTVWTTVRVMATLKGMDGTQVTDSRTDSTVQEYGLHLLKTLEGRGFVEDS